MKGRSIVILSALCIFLILLNFGKRYGDPVWGVINDIIFYILWFTLLGAFGAMVYLSDPKRKGETQDD
jgi:hypothetical protein